MEKKQVKKDTMTFYGYITRDQNGRIVNPIIDGELELELLTSNPIYLYHSCNKPVNPYTPYMI